jgi:sugar phosphate isomerase/epimerase
MDLSNFGMDTITLAGPVDQKLKAVAGAGLSKCMVWARELVADPGGIDGAVRKVRESGVRINGFQLLRDFEGLSGHLLDYKLEIAKIAMEMMQAVGTDLLLVCSSISPYATSDTRRIGHDLARLGALAATYKVRICYEALAWGHGVNEYPVAWEAVKRADRDNVGLMVDSFHTLVKGSSLDYIEEIPPEKIFMVQVSDYLWALDDVIQTARGRRVFPGEGINSAAVTEMVRRLDRAGYRGDYTFEVFNEDYLQCPLPAIAGRARKSAEWLCSQVAGA